jgi:hypothetical protein
MLILIFIWTIKAGKKHMKVNNGKEFLIKNTEEIHEKY